MRGRPGTTNMLRCIVAQVQSFTGAVGQPVPLGPGPPAAPATDSATAGPGPWSRPSGPRPGPTVTLAQVTHQFRSRENQTRKRTGRFALLRDILAAGRPKPGRPRHNLNFESLTHAMKHIFRSIC